MSSTHAIENKKVEISSFQFLGQNTCSLYFDEQQNISYMNASQRLLIKAHPLTTNKDDWQLWASNTESGDCSSNLSPLDEGVSSSVKSTEVQVKTQLHLDEVKTGQTKSLEG